MSGNYPPGVTGLEYEIAGADRAWSEPRIISCGNNECEAVDLPIELTLDLESYRDEEWAYWRCPVCNTEQEYRADIGEDRYFDDNYGEY